MVRRPSAAPDEREPAGGAIRRPLFRGLGVSVVDFRCRAHVQGSGGEEPNPTHSIVFVRRGVFARSGRDGTLLADPTWILFFNEGQPYRFAHPLPGGDDCTILALDGEREPFPVGHAHATPRAVRLHYELLAMTGGTAASRALPAEEVVAELVDEAMRTLRRISPVAADSIPARPDRRREIVEAARLILNRRVEAPPSLVELARALDCSPFHLSRIFRAATGLGLRQYLQRLRVRLAADRLQRGVRDLTGLALDLGFYDHSHFTNAFRREWGVPPSRIRTRDPDVGGPARRRSGRR